MTESQTQALATVEPYELQRRAFLAGVKFEREWCRSETRENEASVAERRFPDPHRRRVTYSPDGVAWRYDLDGTLQRRATFEADWEPTTLDAVNGYERPFIVQALGSPHPRTAP